jgi:hypothetical protein
MPDTTGSPASTPEYARHRDGVSAVENPITTPVTDSRRGMNMRGFLRANIQVIPSGGANPSVEVYFWSDEAGKFIRGHTTLARAGVGADVPYEFSIDVNSRIIFVAVTAIVAGAANVMVGGSELDHLR